MTTSHRILQLEADLAKARADLAQANAMIDTYVAREEAWQRRADKDSATLAAIRRAIDIDGLHAKQHDRMLQEAQTWKARAGAAEKRCEDLRKMLGPMLGGPGDPVDLDAMATTR